MIFYFEFVAATTSASNTPVSITPPRFICAKILYFPAFGNPYGKLTVADGPPVITSVDMPAIPGIAAIASPPLAVTPPPVIGGFAISTAAIAADPSG